MARVFKVLGFLIFLAILWKEGRPWLERQLASGSSSGEAASTIDGDEEAGECVLAARQARDVFGDSMRSVTPGPEADLGFRSDLEGAIDDARHACSCPAPACATASEAVDLLAEASRRLEDPSKVGEVAISAARKLQRVGELLDRAAREAGG